MEPLDPARGAGPRHLVVPSLGAPPVSVPGVRVLLVPLGHDPLPEGAVCRGRGRATQTLDEVEQRHLMPRHPLPAPHTSDGVLLGPGRFTSSVPDEHVEVDKLIAAAKMYAVAALEICG